MTKMSQDSKKSGDGSDEANITGISNITGAVSPALATGFLGAALDCVIVIDHRSCVVEWNGAAEQTFGYKREEALGRNIADLIIPPALREAHYTGLSHYLSTGEGPILNRRIEVCAIRRDGHEFPVELAVVRVEENPPRFAAYLRDISVREEREASLRRSEERFRSLVEATAEIVWTRLPGGEFGEEQPGWSAFTGQTYDELKGWGWLQAIHGEDREEVARAWADAIDTGSLYETEYRMLRGNGAIRRMSVRAAPVREPDGSVREWVGVSTDVTARGETEERLAESEARQRAFLRDVLASVTGGKLRLCDTDADLPVSLPGCGAPVQLTEQSLRAMRHRTMEAAQAAGLGNDRGNDLLTAVGEATQNAVRHAGGGQGWACADLTVGLVQVWVEDQGGGIDVSRLPQATLERGYSGGGGGFGHGFWLMLQTVDRVWLLSGPQGTTVVIEQGREATDPGWLARI